MNKLKKLFVLIPLLLLLPVGRLMAQSATMVLESHISFESVLRGLLGIAFVFAISYLFSVDRKAVNWRAVGIGFAFQLLLAFAIFFVPFVQTIFDVIGKIFIKILSFTKEGTRFLFGDLVDETKFGYIFAFQVLPTIIFFSALTSLLFYLGVIQKVVYVFAWAMSKTMGLTGPESLSVTGNIFLGQTEAPLMIKAYLDDMTPSEIFLVMTGGMATMAGGVLAAYIALLGGTDPVQKAVFAKHLLMASVMAAPGAVVISKILVPQTQKVSTNIQVPKERMGKNILDSFTNGGSDGLKLAANVAAVLLIFVALIAFVNYLLTKFGQITTLNDWLERISNGKYTSFSLQNLLGYIFAPVMWILGVPWADVVNVGGLMGQKLIMTEFIAYADLNVLKNAGVMTAKATIMATYICCGFANFASIGIQVAGIGGLTPKNRPLLTRFGMRALLAGTLAAMMSAAIIGMIYG